jgi:hypothetical protein
MRKLAALYLPVAAALAAALAVSAALASGGAHAAPKPPPTTAPGGFTTGWAVVRVDGSLARGSGAVSSQQLGVDGEYEVVFNRDVSGCAYVATAGEAGSFPPDDAITFGVAGREGNPNAVFLIEYDAVLARDSYSSGFHLVVHC